MDQSSLFPDGDLSDYNIILDNVITCERFMLSTRVLAAELKINPYKTLKDYFNNLKDQDVFELSNRIDRDELEEVLLLSEMLAFAEGSKSENLEDVTRNVNLFGSLIICESLYRKGLVDIVRENMSFDTSYYDKPVVRRKKLDD